MDGDHRRKDEGIGMGGWRQYEGGCGEGTLSVENLWKAGIAEGMEGFRGERCGKLCSTWNSLLSIEHFGNR